MIELDNRTLLSVDIIFLEKISSELTDKDIELIVTDVSEIQTINKEYRNIDEATDVLSFPYEELPLTLLGSIVISSLHVQQKAKELGHTEDEELSLLFIHGLLHILGYDHETDNGEMRKEEQRLIQKFQLPKSLIVRTEG